MKKIIIFLIALTIGILIFGLVTTKIGFKEIIKAFTLFSWQGLIVILILTFLIVLTDTWKLKYILQSMGHRFSYSETAKIYLMGFAMTYLTHVAVWGGEFIMIYALKKKYSVSWEKSIASIFIFRAVDATIFFPFLVLGVFIFPFFYGGFSLSNTLIYGAIVTAIFVILILYFYIKSFKKQSVLSGILKFFGKNPEEIKKSENGKLFFEGEKEVLKFFGPRKKEMWIAIVNSIIKYLLSLLRVWFLIFFFKGGTDILKALSVYGFVNFSTLVPIPAQLGILEASEAVVFQGFGLGANLGIAFSFLLRTMDSLVSLSGIVFIFKLGFDSIKRKLFETLDKFSFL
jgi:uncharacterized protein (TIRG00374 family)